MSEHNAVNRLPGTAAELLVAIRTPMICPKKTYYLPVTPTFFVLLVMIEISGQPGREGVVCWA
jgi:hypothetical protein